VREEGGGQHRDEHQRLHVEPAQHSRRRGEGRTRGDRDEGGARAAGGVGAVEAADGHKDGLCERAGSYIYVSMSVSV